ncbi:hypothetical protein BK136_25145 [Paenibacillus amylolyticus]|nr:hypothetical protein BK136_25145 [Paenibacillus amylolyticus]
MIAYASEVAFFQKAFRRPLCFLRLFLSSTFLFKNLVQLIYNSRLEVSRGEADWLLCVVLAGQAIVLAVT